MKTDDMEACAESGRKLVCSLTCPLKDSFNIGTLINVLCLVA